MSFRGALRRRLPLFPQVVVSKSSTFRLLPPPTSTPVSRSSSSLVFFLFSRKMSYRHFSKHPSVRPFVRTRRRKETAQRLLCVVASGSASVHEESERNRDKSGHSRWHQLVSSPPVRTRPVACFRRHEYFPSSPVKRALSLLEFNRCHGVTLHR